MNIQKGDKVKCIDAGSFSLTNGKTYYVTRMGNEHNSGKPTLTVVNDHGITVEYYCERFEKVNHTRTIDEWVELARSYVGKKVVYTDGNKFVFDKVLVVVDAKEANHKCGASSLEQFQKDGFVVSLAKHSGAQLPIQSLTLAKDSIDMELTEEYKASITKTEVKVGCQTISREKIEELLKHMQSLD